ncbi:serine/threonine-protein kinase-like protein At3g51990 [Dioscorea cayenensis subsp. rotundata]|uniref:Serine/threonine-protein kinase-like protein At3g51990 n=1 Tax=Dioscorea cayennensis subsp. rotundata TaxID=55577 RepID=A0AB40CA59_DIOCR|nr:serine/threonine-protein kinase-like protein At3g51990 [Dioscorea cayenensis subsp. rotundata]
MGYLSCRAESSVMTCRSVAALAPNQLQKPNSSIDLDHPDAAPPIRVFSYRELETATSSFSDKSLLGRGSHGTVYKAVLGDGRPVAVKRPSRRPAHAQARRNDEVENEIRILSRLRSPRLVNLIGFTDPEPSRLLVVEFMPNGTLYDFLHSNRRPPGWARRLRLVLQTAKALLTLHSARPPVIHRDVKAANVLIDHRFNARLGDFGLALRDDSTGLSSSSVRSTPPAGTLGYLDPCYVTPENLSTKTDVFSFGILLLEIMSGRKAIDVAYSPPSVVEWAVPLLKKGKVLALYDPRIEPPRDTTARRQLASLAASCVRSSKERRPSMEEVVERLKVLCKALSSKSWNGLSVVNPCLMVETEQTVLKLNVKNLDSNLNSSPISRCASLDEDSVRDEEAAMEGKKLHSLVRPVRPVRNARKVFSDGGAKSSVNLMDLMGGSDGEAINGGVRIGGKVNHGSMVRRARIVQVARA